MDSNLNIKLFQLRMDAFNVQPVVDADRNVDDQNHPKRQLVFGPPTIHFGPRPPMSCELYVTNLPANLDHTKFSQWLNRIGSVYEMRIMMNTPSETRGYCFVRFFEEKAALAAYELLSYVFINNKRPSAQGSQCKRQLFAGGIPKSLALKDVRESFRKIFPSMIKCVIYSSTNAVPGQKNRGFAFLEFCEHDAALNAKKYLRNTRVFGQYVKVDWARVRKTKVLDSSATLIESFADLKKNDYCAKLRLYAIANNWCVPVVVYGSSFKQHSVQYCGVLLKDPSSSNYCCVIVEVIDMTRIFDIHVLICEVATHLVEVIRGIPPKNYVVRVRSATTAKIVFSFMDINELINFSLTSDKFVSVQSVIELMTSLNILAQCTPEIILNAYKSSFQTPFAVSDRIAMFRLIKEFDYSHFLSVYPKFRDNYPLNNNFNDTEIILLQATASCDIGNCMSLQDLKRFLSTRTPDEGAFVLKSQRYNRHPNYILNYIDLDSLRNLSFYHPTQQVNTPPLWVRGETYQTSIFEYY